MHIPDGYLGPQTCVPMLGVMAVYWSVALRRLKSTLRLRQAPLLALGAAFSFVIMMFNVPIPGGSTGHAVGAVLVAILLGPWAAGVAVSLALIAQALLFGDGGIMAIGANCLIMGVIMPFIGWGIYRLAASGQPADSARQWIGAAMGGYLGSCAASIVAGILFGLQPLIAHDAAGRALYCPFGLGVAVPAMAVEHFLFFGFVEAMVTALVVVYFQRAAPAMLAAGTTATAGERKLIPVAATAIGALIILSPLGLFLPEKSGTGAAWGEWSGEQLKLELGKTGGEAYVPEGVKMAEEHGWKAPLPRYALPGQAKAPPSYLGVAYAASALIGAAVLMVLIMALSKLLTVKESSHGVT